MIKLKCDNCGDRLERDPADPRRYICPACKYEYLQEESTSRLQLDVRVFAPPAPQADAANSAADEINRFREYLVRQRKQVSETQRELSAARAARVNAEQQRAEVFRERRSVIGGALVGAIICFLIGLAADSDRLAFLFLGAAILLICVIAYQINRALKTRSQADSAAADAQKRASKLTDEIARLEHNIVIGEQKISALRIEANARADMRVEQSVPGMRSK